MADQLVSAQTSRIDGQNNQLLSTPAKLNHHSHTLAAVLTNALDGKEMENGQFFIYQREGKDIDEEVALCVVYKGKGTHHLLQHVDGNWIINKKSFGTFDTLEKVREHCHSLSAIAPIQTARVDFSLKQSHLTPT